jgi:hypothetical protein
MTISTMKNRGGIVSKNKEPIAKFLNISDTYGIKNLENIH